MKTLPYLQRLNTNLYEQLQRQLSEIQSNSDAKSSFAGQVRDFLRMLHEAGPDVTSIDDYEWMHRVMVNWQSVMASVLDSPMKIEPIPLPKDLDAYVSPSDDQKAPGGLRMLPFRALIEVARDIASKREDDSTRANLAKYIIELQFLGYEIEESYKRYFLAIHEATLKILDVEERINSLNKVVLLSKNFVVKQRGIWEHQQWIQHLLKLQEEGLDTSMKMLSYYGGILEAMKGIYSSASETSNLNALMEAVAQMSVSYFERHAGEWDPGLVDQFRTHLTPYQEKMGREANEYLQTLFDAYKKYYLAFIPSKE